MRFDAEHDDPENTGLDLARMQLETVKKQHPLVSYADLYVLAGCEAIERMGGPHMPFRQGRKDYSVEEASVVYGANRCPFGDGTLNPHGSRLPAADLGRSETVSDQVCVLDKVRSGYIML
jgi:catalase (peroxidase I)